MKKITPIEQTTSTECGLCCLYMMLDYFDKYIGRLVKMEERQRKSGKIIEDFLDYL